MIITKPGFYKTRSGQKVELLAFRKGRWFGIDSDGGARWWFENGARGISNCVSRLDIISEWLAEPGKRVVEVAGCDDGKESGMKHTLEIKPAVFAKIFDNKEFPILWKNTGNFNPHDTVILQEKGTKRQVKTRLSYIAKEYNFSGEILLVLADAEEIAPEISPKSLREEYAIAALTRLLAHPDIKKAMTENWLPLQTVLDMAFEAADEAMKRRERA